MGKFKDRLKQISQSAIFKGAVKSLPFGIGSFAGSILDETSKSEAGSVSKEELLPQLIKLAFYLVLVYLAIKGTVSFEELEQVKDALTP